MTDPSSIETNVKRSSQWEGVYERSYEIFFMNSTYSKVYISDIFDM
jgi:hypothetical protein